MGHGRRYRHLEGGGRYGKGNGGRGRIEERKERGSRGGGDGGVRWREEDGREGGHEGSMKRERQNAVGEGGVESGR